VNPTKTLLAALALALALSVPAGAVSGGQQEPIAQAPYVVWLDGRCTGTLISPTRILTAGHCIDGISPTGRTVLLGIDGNTATSKQRRAHALEVRGFSVAPGYKLSFPFAHNSPEDAIAVDDVGLILLKQPVKNVKPVALGDAPPGAAATILGYGMTEPEPTTKPLQQGALTVITPQACGLAYPRAIRATMICTQDLLPHAPLVQACAGDSGGPVITNTATGPVQIGVTSWGPEVMDGLCGEKPLPLVEMRVSSFSSFLTAKDPPIEPSTLKTGGAGQPLISGAAHVGNTVTCHAPKLGGDPAKLTYSWSVTHDTDFRTIPNAHKDTLKVSSGVYKKADAARRLFCTVTARNAGGHLELLSGSVHMRRS
jgi:hypothetical protein